QQQKMLDQPPTSLVIIGAKDRGNKIEDPLPTCFVHRGAGGRVDDAQTAKDIERGLSLLRKQRTRDERTALDDARFPIQASGRPRGKIGQCFLSLPGGGGTAK